MNRFNFVHLNVHSHYSIMDGCASIEELVDAAIKDRMPGIAITDNGNMSGVMELFDYATRINNERKLEGKKPFKPIIGCELYVSRHGSKEHKDGIKDMKGYHLLVLAKNLIGYRNLIKIVSNAWTEGYYMNPRTDRMDLEKYHEGLIVLSGGFGSEVHAKIAKNDMAGLDETIEWYKQTFADDYYLEVQRNIEQNINKDNPSNPTLELQSTNAILLEKAKEHGVKVVATNDVHYIKQRDSEAYCIQQCETTGKTLDEFNSEMPSSSRWLRSRKEMCTLFADIPEAIASTTEIYNKAEIYDIHHTPLVPSIEIPQEFEHCEDKEYEYLKYLSYSKAKQLYGEQLPDEVTDRLDFELQTIKQRGASNYFLFLQDVVNTAQKELGVWVGPGRGSAAGSLVNYCLGITQIDPLKHDLLFERFLSPDGTAFPDIDLDFDWEGRLRVVDWLKQKYGEACFAHIVTFGKFMTKGAFSTVTQAMQIPQSVSSPITQALSYHNIYPWHSLKDALRYAPEVKKAVRKVQMPLHNAFESTSTLEGKVYKTGIHACGIVVSDDAINNWAPLMTADIEDNDGNKKLLSCVQYDGLNIENSGLMKFDFLGLETLSKMKDIIQKIVENKGISIDIERIPIDDPKTFELFQNGNTEDVFQYDSLGMRKFLVDFHPTCFEDLVILNCLYRPGPMGYIATLVRQKHSKKAVKYMIPCSEKYLHNTYGIIVYQEQIMMLSRLIANFDRSESDLLRKAFGKRKMEVLSVLKPHFIEGGIKNGHKKNALEKVWNEMEAKGMYAFQKSHAVCYTWMAYQMAYLKANYPEEFGGVIEKYN